MQLHTNNTTGGDPAAQTTGINLNPASPGAFHAPLSPLPIPNPKSKLTNDSSSNRSIPIGQAYYSEAIDIKISSATPALLECHTALSLEKWYAQLRAKSPTPCTGRKSKGSKHFIRHLFPKHQLLSVGTWLRDFRTGFADELFAAFPRMGLIVPGYMTKRWGMTLGDPDHGIPPHPSPCCKEDTGRNQYIIFKNSRVGLNEQARRIIQLAGEYRLAMVVHATPNILEAWFPAHGFTKVKITRLEKTAREYSLGGSASQPWHPYAVPEGYSYDQRTNTFGERQSVIFFDKAALPPAKVSP